MFKACCRGVAETDQQAQGRSLDEVCPRQDIYTGVLIASRAAEALQRLVGELRATSEVVAAQQHEQDVQRAGLGGRGLNLDVEHHRPESRIMAGALDSVRFLLQACPQLAQ